MHRFCFRIIPLLSLAFSALAQPVGLVPLNASGIYSVGDTVGWTVTSMHEAIVPEGGYACTLKLNNATLLKTVAIDPSRGPVRVEARISEPAMVYFEIAPAAPGEKPVAAGAAVSPEQLGPVAPRPADFDAFWATKIAMLQNIPANPVLTPGESGKEGVEFATLRLDNIGDSHVYGQLARPARAGKFPAVLMMQWAGGPYPLQKSWVVDRAAQGWLALDVEPHDVPCDMPQSFYDELPAIIRQYHMIYNDDRERCYFLRMFLGDYRALDYLASRPDWDGRILVATGGSMGGMQSFAVAALHPKVTHMIVDVPAGADSNAALHSRHESYPFWDSSNPKVMQTALYFDPVNFAQRIHARCLVSLGFIDNVSAPTGVWTAFNLIAGPKEAVPMINAAHNHQSTPEQMKAYTDRSAEWFASLAREEEPQVKPLKTASTR